LLFADRAIERFQAGFGGAPAAHGNTWLFDFARVPGLTKAC
jgi:hypothetical protein